MDVIDQEGRLFGVVNVVDALVVLVVLAMLVAGIALLMGGDDATDQPDPPEPERFATLSFDVPLGSDAATLAAGDSLSAVAGGESYAVTDVYRGFTPEGRAHVVATVRYRGRMVADGSTIYGGDAVGLTTGSYRVDATLVGVNRTDGAIPTATRRVVLVANVSSTVADAIEAGATASIGDTPVATVTAVETTRGPGDRERILVGANVTVWDRQPVAAFDGQALRVGNRVTLVTDTVTIPGRVAAADTDDPATVSEG